MPISMDGSGNVDTARGTVDCAVCGAPLAGTGWDFYTRRHHFVRERVEPSRIQPWRPICRTCATRPELMARPRQDLFATSLEAAFRVAELTNDADDHGADDALGGA